MKKKHQKTIQGLIDGITMSVIILSMVCGLQFLIMFAVYQIATIDFMYFGKVAYNIFLCVLLLGVLLLICCIFKTLDDCCKFILTEYKEFKKDKKGLLTPLITAKI
jgi:hypothetical protein